MSTTKAAPRPSDGINHLARLAELEARVKDLESRLEPLKLFVHSLESDPVLRHQLILWARRIQRHQHGALSALVYGLAALLED